MDIKKSIMIYFNNRKKANGYSKFIELSGNLVSKVNCMGNAKIIKPSEFQIDEMIKQCIRLKNSLINEATKKDSELSSILAPEELDLLGKSDITSLSECKTIASLCLNISLRLQREKTPKGYLPIFSSMNFREIIGLTIIGLIIFIVILK